jgi:hypothetical protein
LPRSIQGKACQQFKAAAKSVFVGNIGKKLYWKYRSYLKLLYTKTFFPRNVKALQTFSPTFAIERKKKEYYVFKVETMLSIDRTTRQSIT